MRRGPCRILTELKEALLLAADGGLCPPASPSRRRAATSAATPGRYNFDGSGSVPQPQRDMVVVLSITCTSSKRLRFLVDFHDYLPGKRGESSSETAMRTERTEASRSLILISRFSRSDVA